MGSKPTSKEDGARKIKTSQKKMQRKEKSSKATANSSTNPNDHEYGAL